MDRYKRVVAQIYLGKESVNALMIVEGLAWQYLKYSTSKELRPYQLAARSVKQGLWADPKAVPPWEWRKNRHQRRMRTN